MLITTMGNLALDAMTCNLQINSIIFCSHSNIKPPRQSEEEREIGALALTALESAVRKDAFPKANVDVFCLVMQVAVCPN